MRISQFFSTAFAVVLFLLVPLESANTVTPKILVSLRPFHSLAANVMQGVATPTLLIDAKQSPHTFHLRPSDVELIYDADLVVWVGPELEFFLKPLLENRHNQLQILTIKDMKLLPLQADAHQLSHHKHGVTDPHLWLNPQNAKRFVTKLAAVLQQLDPEHFEQYAENAQRLTKQLDTLDSELQTKLKPYQDQPFLVFHDSLRYFANHYKLQGLRILTPNPEQPITVKQYTDSKRNIKTLGIKCLFKEAQFDPPIIKKLAKSTGISVGTLDPLGTTQGPADQSYFVMMRNLATELVTCFSQSTSKKE